MKIVILFHQILQEKFAFSEFFMLVMIGYIFMFRMVKKMQNSGLERVAGLRLVWTMEFFMFTIFEISWFLSARGSVLQVQAKIKIFS